MVDQHRHSDSPTSAVGPGEATSVAYAAPTLSTVRAAATDPSASAGQLARQSSPGAAEAVAISDGGAHAGTRDGPCGARFSFKLFVSHSFPPLMTESVLLFRNSMDSILADNVLEMTQLDLQKRFPVYHVCPKCLAALLCGSAFL